MSQASPPAAEPSSKKPLSPFQERLRTYLRAGYPILYVVTAEEDRAVELIGGLVADGELAKRRPYVWSVSRGLRTLDLKPVDRRTADPKRILPFLLEFKDPGVFILEDFHFFLDERSPTAPLVARQIRDLVGPFKAARKTVVLLSSVLKLPPELAKDLTVVDLEMPGEEELAALLDDTVEQVKENPRVEVNLGDGGREKILKALTGLTCSEADNALAKVIVTRSRLDPEDVGLLLVGVPGCGKSLSAKAVAAEWKMPLLKFDLGKVFGSLVGQSEENMRRALKMAEAVAHCVLWIDEIERGLSGVRGQTGDIGHLDPRVRHALDLDGKEPETDLAAHVRDVAIAEPPPRPKKPKRVFDV